MIDLHTHSTASDGTDSPAGLVAAAAAAGVTVLGLTDHDTVAGWEAATKALPAHMTLLPGMEISAVWDGPGDPISIHLLGYLVDPDDAALSDRLQRVRESRVHRGEQIVQRMVAAGLPITWDQVREIAGGGTVGRPHIARALVAAGVVGSVPEAFEDLTSSRSPFYVRKEDVPVREAIALVRGAGGVPVFAHPLARRRGRVVSLDDIAALAAAGLAGVEVDHPDHAPDDRRALAGLAADLELIPLGSSDYHGTNKPTPLAAETTAPAAFERLTAAAHNPVRTGGA